MENRAERRLSGEFLCDIFAIPQPRIKTPFSDIPHRLPAPQTSSSTKICLITSVNSQQTFYTAPRLNTATQSLPIHSIGNCLTVMSLRKWKLARTSLFWSQTAKICCCRHLLSLNHCSKLDGSVAKHTSSIWPTVFRLSASFDTLISLFYYKKINRTVYISFV